MSDISVDLAAIDSRFVDQLKYSLAFVAGVHTHDIDTEASLLRVAVDEGADPSEVEAAVRTLIERYAKSDFGQKSLVYYENKFEGEPFDAWAALIERRWVTEVGSGHVILRNAAETVAGLIDHMAMTRFATEFEAEKELYPPTIKCETLDRVNHFTSFPEHVAFVAPIKSDVQVLEAFSKDCEEGPWSSDMHDGRMAEHEFAISPSCCYHCYEGMEDWELEAPGRCMTSKLSCQRFEGANQRALVRLRSFSMREVIWVGHPKWVLESRARADELIVEVAQRWGLACTYETANDMFFTDDYAVKASFQRNQEAKKELRAWIPQEGAAISVFSSNFHAASFSKAFNITVNGRPAASACIGFGLERFMYALFSQFGLDTNAWPEALRADLAAYQEYQT